MTNRAHVLLWTDQTAPYLDAVKAAGLAERLTMEIGDAQSIDAPAASVDAISISFGIRNVPDRDRALREMARVVKPGGRVVILELAEPTTPVLGPLARWHIHTVVPAIGAALSGVAWARAGWSGVCAVALGFAVAVFLFGFVDRAAQADRH